MHIAECFFIQQRNFIKNESSHYDVTITHWMWHFGGIIIILCQLKLDGGGSDFKTEQYVCSFPRSINSTKIKLPIFVLVCGHTLLPSNYVQASQAMLQCKFLITTGNNSLMQTQTLVTEFHMVLCWLHYSLHCTCFPKAVFSIYQLKTLHTQSLLCRW